MLTLHPPRGRPRYRRIEFTTTFLDRLSDGQEPGWYLAMAGGWRHYSGFSALLHRRSITASPITLERFYQLADVLKFPRGDVFREVQP